MHPSIQQLKQAIDNAERTMSYELIPYDQLKRSPVNVSKNATIDPAFLQRMRKSFMHVGIVQPLVVRPNGEGYEVVAGDKRYQANGLDGAPVIDPVPCVIRIADDFEAGSVSLVENTHRQALDPLSEHEAYADLVKQGKKETEIAEIFGVTELDVRRSLALANLLPEIKQLYRDQTPEPCGDEDDDDGFGGFAPIGKQELQALTLATKKRQKEFYKLFMDREEDAPMGMNLREWAREKDGEGVPVARALFDPAEYKGAYINDLFAAGGEEFADATEFWRLQDKAIEALKQQYLERGADFVHVSGPREFFSSWEWRGTGDETGGVVIDVHHNGEVQIHENVVQRGADGPAGAQLAERAKEPEKPKRAELSQESVNYVQLRKQATVRAELLANPMLAVRVLIANALAWADSMQDDHVTIRADHTNEIEDHAADIGWREARATIARHLPEGDVGLSESIADRRSNKRSLMAALEGMRDEQVLTVLAALASESLGRRNELVEIIGQNRGLDLTDQWDNLAEFLEGVRDKEALQGMLREAAGADVAEANASKTGKQLRQLILEHAPADWRPRYFKFPATHYTDRETAL